MLDHLNYWFKGFLTYAGIVQAVFTYIFTQLYVTVMNITHLFLHIYANKFKIIWHCQLNILQTPATIMQVYIHTVTLLWRIWKPNCQINTGPFRPIFTLLIRIRYSLKYLWKLIIHMHFYPAANGCHTKIEICVMWILNLKISSL